MHATAAHLDGRYTWAGELVGGQDVADALLVGDRVIRATIVEAPAPP
jgi:cyclophilin family peptidyl-prolyl cis-trans isomerase